ncbi:transcriptional regulator FnrL [Oceanomicrobium pacificus]|uniref:Helix-turn-helix domain-containing protein n=1 Tax=Oceanomicrobium pacificus TaxID=2692916 RepID=A0A6B0TLY9_9RHOB|nr:Crp/Fnr family transcriptional regulator [Oceanomicrobium pacificus]MXU65570.1 helix-turn-helix domain-containing protein [Oceanomicrobium pacificus]
MPQTAPTRTAQSCPQCPIRHSAVCSLCGPSELAELDAIKTYQTFQAGDVIAWAGEPQTIVGSVVSGVATLSRTLADGRRQMVGLLLPSDFIGRSRTQVAPYDVTAATEVTLCTFRKRAFDEMLDRTMHIERRLLQMTLDELDAAREWMLLLGRKTAREKIASLLVIVARRDAALHRREVGNGVSFRLPLTREAMADYLGLTIETVSRQISALRKAGVVEMHGTRDVTIPDFGRLLDESGDDADGGIVS